MAKRHTRWKGRVAVLVLTAAAAFAQLAAAMVVIYHH
jgi:hypothetical protein